MAVDGSLIFDTGLDSGGFEADLGKLASSATTAAAAVAAAFTTIAVTASAAAFDVGMAYESAFAGVKKTVNETASISYDDINAEIRDMAKNTMPAAASAISAVAESAGQLGIATKDITNFSEVMVNLGEATNLSADAAASSLAKFANITQMDSSNYENLGSAIVALGNNFATTEADIVNMSMRLASAATTAGMAETDILGFSAAMSSVGIEADAGGSAMSTFIKQLQTAVETGEKLEEFADIAGMTADAFTRLWNSDAAGAVTAFIGNLNNFEEHGRSAVQILDEMGFTEIRLSNTLLALASSGDLMTRAVEQSNQAWEENSALMNEVEKRYATTESVMNITKNNLADIGITVYDKFQKPLVTAFEAATGGFQKFNDRISDGDLSGKLENTAEAFERLAVTAADFVAEDVLPAMVNGLAWIAENGDTLISEIAGAAAAIVTFKIATQGAATAQAAFNALAKVNPYVLIASAAAGLIASITTLAITEENHYKAMSRGTGIYDEQVKAVERLTEEYNEAKEAAQGIIDSQEDEIAQLSAMKKLLDENVDANGKVIGDYETVKSLIEEINEIYPEEISLINGKIEKYGELTGKMDDYIQKLREEALYESKIDTYKQAVVTYEETSAKNDELYNNYAEAVAAADEAKKKYDWFKSGINRYTAGDQRRAEEAGKTVKQYLADMYYSTQGDMEAAASAYQKNWDLMKQAEADMKEFENSFSTASTPAYSLTNAYSTAAEAVAQAQYEDLKKKAAALAEEQEKNTQKLVTAWEKAEHEYNIGTIATEEELFAKKRELWEKYGNANLKDHWDYLEDLAQYDKAYAEEQRAIAEENAKKAAEEAEKQLEEQKGIVDDGLNEILDEYQDAYNELDRKRTEYRNKLLSVGGDLFSVDVSEGENGEEITTYTVNNLEEQLRKMREYHSQITALKNQGASEALLGELTSLSDEDSAQFAQYLSGMSASEFAKINALYNEKQALADELSKDLYKSEAQLISDSMTSALADLATSAYSYGASAAQQFSEGFRSAMDELGVGVLYNQIQASGASRVYENYVTGTQSGDIQALSVSVDVTGKSNVYLDGKVVGEAVTNYQGEQKRQKGT